MKLAWIVLVLACPASALGADDMVPNLSGSAKVFPLVNIEPSNDLLEGQTSSFAVGSLRLNALWSNDELNIEGAYHLFPLVRSSLGLVSGAGTQGGTVAPVRSPLRIVDFDREVVDRENFVLLQNLDRLVVSFYMPGGVELRVGRQAINHGSARLFPATDIFSPFSPATLDTEFKQGVDALRLTWPFGELAEFEFYAIALDHDSQESVSRGVYMARYRQSVIDVVDVSVYGGTSYSSPTFGLDLAGDISGATVYAEGFVRIWDEGAADSLAPIAQGSAERTVRATLGGQYFFPFELDVAVELHWNGPGSSERSGYFNTTLRPEWNLSEIYLLGKAYLGTLWSYAATDLVRLSVSTITNLTDGSTLLAPSVFWDASENASLSAGAILGLGQRLNRDFIADEFGLYPMTVYSDIRFYF